MVEKSASGISSAERQPGFSYNDRKMFIFSCDSSCDVGPSIGPHLEFVKLSQLAKRSKVEISLCSLIPKAKEATKGKTPETEGQSLKFNEELLEFLIDSYTQEAGVSELDEVISSIFAMASVQDNIQVPSC